MIQVFCSVIKNSFFDFNTRIPLRSAARRTRLSRVRAQRLEEYTLFARIVKEGFGGKENDACESGISIFCQRIVRTPSSFSKIDRLRIHVRAQTHAYSASDSQYFVPSRQTRPNRADVCLGTVAARAGSRVKYRASPTGIEPATFGFGKQLSARGTP